MSSILQILSDIKYAIRSHIFLILSISLLAAGTQAFITRSVKGEYETYSKIFPLSINKASGSNPLDGIRAQFGISDKTDYEKIYNVKELVTSRTISTIVAKSNPRNKKYNSLSTWLIDDYNTNKPFWKNKITVSSSDTNELHATGAGLLLSNTIVSNDAKTGFTTISTTSHEGALSQEMNEKILEELGNYYIRLVTEKPRTDLYKIKLMRDSLQVALYANERAIAGFIDANQMSVKTTTQLPQVKLERMQKEIEALYTTTATSYQNAKFKLLSESPIFQVLDQPGQPYSFTKPNWKKAAVIVFVITFFILCLFFSRKVIWRMIIEELSKS